MDKPVKVYVQQYKHKARITIEIELESMRQYKGHYKIFRLYTSTWKELYETGELIHKATLQYNGKHLLQAEVVDVACCTDMIDRLMGLEYCEVIPV